MGVPVKFQGPADPLLVLSVRLLMAVLNHVEGVKLDGLNAPPLPGLWL